MDDVTIFLVVCSWAAAVVAGGVIGDWAGHVTAGSVLGLFFGPFGVLIAALLPRTPEAEAAWQYKVRVALKPYELGVDSPVANESGDRSVAASPPPGG